MARGIRLAAPPLAVLVVVGVVLAVVLSGGKSSAPRHREPSASATGGEGLTTQGGVETKAATRATGVSGKSAAGAASAANGNGGTPAGGANAGAPATGQKGVSHPTRKSVTGPAGSPGGSPSLDANGAGGSPVVTAEGKLASNSSETGTWSTVSVLGPELEPTLTTAKITFPVALAHVIPEGRVIFINEAETIKPGRQRSLPIREACGESGTLDAPTAQPGHLCVYAGVEDLRDRNAAGGVPTHEVHGTQTPFIDAEFIAIENRNLSPGTDRTGASVAFGVPAARNSEEEADHAYPHIIANGTWAVSAP